LAEENPGLGQAVSRLWRLARLDADYFEGLTAAHLAAEPDPGTRPGPEPAGGRERAGQGAIVTRARELAGVHPALRLRLYKAALDRLGPGESRAETIFDLDEAFQEGRLGRVFQFPGGKLARITSRGVEFFRIAGPLKPGRSSRRKEF